MSMLAGSGLGPHLRIAVIASLVAAAGAACSSSSSAPAAANLDGAGDAQAPGDSAVSTAADGSGQGPDTGGGGGGTDAGGGTDTGGSADSASDDGAASTDAADIEVVQASYDGTSTTLHTIYKANVSATASPSFDLEAYAGAVGTLPWVTLQFFPPKTGTYSCAFNAGGLINIQPATDYYWGANGGAQSSCSLVVTRLDAVGGWVDGTFTGTFVKYAVTGGGSLGTTTAVTGSFHVRRKT